MSTMNQKPNEAGWFYHAPAKKENREPVGAPPASQIPGLGEITVLPPEEPREMVFRDTDSKYIQLAKMGGRKDLLTIRPNSGTKREAKGYPRSDWFYLEDNAQQDAARQDKDKEPWKFLLPDYMVYQSMGETTLPVENPDAPREGIPMRRAPYAVDEQLPSKGKSTSMKPPHTRRPGCIPKTERGRPHSSQDDSPRLKYQPLPKEKEEPTNMTKLLSYSYEREWHDKHQAWEEKQAKNRDKSQLVKSPELNKSSRKSPTAPQKSGRKQKYDTNNNHMPTARKPEEEKKEPFKLSKFKNVSARSDTHQRPEVLAAMGK